MNAHPAGMQGETDHDAFASCASGRKDATVFTCVGVWNVTGPMFGSDTVHFFHPVRISLAAGRISVAPYGEPCEIDLTTGAEAGACSAL